MQHQQAVGPMVKTAPAQFDSAMHAGPVANNDAESWNAVQGGRGWDVGGIQVDGWCFRQGDESSCLQGMLDD